MTSLAFAGIVGPLLFTLLVIVQGLLQPDYSHIAMPISALAAWPFGWLQNLNFFVFGALMTAFAAGLLLERRSAGSSGLAIAPLVVSGLGIVLAGVFPMKLDATGAIGESPGHVVASFMAFLGAGIGLIAVSRVTRTDPNWRSLSGYAFACGITMVVLFVVLGTLAMPDDGPLHRWAGLLQRIVLTAWFPCIILLAARLMRVVSARSGRASRGTRAAIA